MTGSPSLDFEGRTVLVTGASRGIGEAIARSFADRGAAVILAARSGAEIARVADELGGRGSRAIAVTADMTNRDDPSALMDRTREEFGGLDVLVNNAGVLPAAARAENVSWQQWDETLQVNLSTPWYLACRARELMTSGGVIINNASTAAFFPRGVSRRTTSASRHWSRSRVSWLSSGHGRAFASSVSRRE